MGDKHLDKERILVMFRWWRKGGGVIALFPYEEWDGEKGTCSSYEHFGQHGGTDYYLVMAATRPATPQEYQPLIDELSDIGYRLRVITRRGTRRAKKEV